MGALPLSCLSSRYTSELLSYLRQSDVELWGRVRDVWDDLNEYQSAVNENCLPQPTATHQSSWRWRDLQLNVSKYEMPGMRWWTWQPLGMKVPKTSQRHAKLFKSNMYCGLLQNIYIIRQFESPKSFSKYWIKAAVWRFHLIVQAWWSCSLEYRFSASVDAISKHAGLTSWWMNNQHYVLVQRYFICADNI